MANAQQTQAQSKTKEQATPPMSSVDELLDKVDIAADEELPYIKFSEAVEDEKAQGKYTSFGFPKLTPGFKAIGYLVGSGTESSDYDSTAGAKTQRVFYVRGTIRAFFEGSDARADVMGTCKLGQTARLREALAEVVRDEKRTGKKILIQIELIGRNKDTLNPDGTKKRSGALIWEVKQMKPVEKSAPPPH